MHNALTEFTRIVYLSHQDYGKYSKLHPNILTSIFFTCIYIFTLHLLRTHLANKHLNNMASLGLILYLSSVLLMSLCQLPTAIEDNRKASHCCYICLVTIFNYPMILKWVSL
ncbi:hypothetical protein YC2023_002425 [Brassica napus]